MTHLAAAKVKVGVLRAASDNIPCEDQLKDSCRSEKKRPFDVEILPHDLFGRQLRPVRSGPTERLRSRLHAGRKTVLFLSLNLNTDDCRVAKTGSGQT